jgi:hypothetical protein
LIRKRNRGERTHHPARGSDSLDERISVVLKLEVLSIPLLADKDRGEDDCLVDNGSDQVEFVELGRIVSDMEIEERVEVVSDSLGDGVERSIEVAEA